MATRLYDQERDAATLIDFELGMPAHLGRLAASLKCLLVAPENPIVRQLSEAALASFEEWYERQRPEDARRIQELHEQLLEAIPGGVS